MQKQLLQVKKFHEVYNCFRQEQPASISKKERDTRIMLMKEELKEVIEAMKNEAIENIAKELSEHVYVVFGTYEVYGFQEKAEEIFKEVHRRNMSKLD